jgi:PAS domain S-box-containing protein
MISSKKTRVRHIPFRLLLLTAGSLFIAEALIMFFLLPHMPPMSRTVEAIFDAFILTALVFPILHIFLFRPMILHITERRRAEEASRLAYAELNQVFQTAAGGMRVIDKEFNMIRINETFEKLAGISQHDAVGNKCYEVFQSAHCHTPRCSMRRVLGGEEHIELESIRERKDGIIVPCVLTATAFRDPNNEIVGIVEDFKDMTEYKILEKQLIQAQKMEAIGQFSGGIAHDFNNILTAIIGYGNLLKIEVSQDHLKTYIIRILKSAQRAANLTKSLLAFSRGQIITFRPVNLNEIIRGVENLLTSLMGEDIEIATTLSNKYLTVMADSGQIEQVLMNLATNARDAMPEGGKFIIRTDHMELDNEFIRVHGFGQTGMYAVITVADTGQGIDEMTKEKIFEPFFTTKEVGKGTGLGLSMVYGIIQQHEGFIDVQSESGKGTTFTMYLPLVVAPVEETIPFIETITKRGHETVLVAEDDPHVRELTKEVLEGYGYKVLDATDGENALHVYHNNKDHIGLLLLDIIMPNKNGKEVYDVISQERPDIKVLFISGYDEDVIYSKGLLDTGTKYLSKPLSPDELLYKVREVLDK